MLLRGHTHNSLRFHLHLPTRIRYAGSMTTAKLVKARENRLRRVLERHGFALTKSRERLIVPNRDNYGLYRVVDAKDRVIIGKRFDWTIEDIVEWLQGRRQLRTQRSYCTA